MAMLPLVRTATGHPNVMKLYPLLLLIHLAASGAQVFSSIVLADGTNSNVFSFVYVVFGSIECIAFALFVDYYAFIDGIRDVFVHRKHLWCIIALGLNNAMKTVCLMLALKYTNALNAAVYIPCIPITAMIMTRVLGWEKNTDWRQLIGVAVAISGALLVTVMRYKSETSDNGVSKILLGNVLLVIWNVNVAGAIVFQKPLLKHYSPLNLSCYIASTASIFLGLFVPFIDIEISRWNLSGLAWGAVVYCGSFLVLMSWGDALAVTLIPASTVAMWLVLEPVFTALLSWVVIGDIVSIWESIGSGLTCIGLVVVIKFTPQNETDDDIVLKVGSASTEYSPLVSKKEESI